MSQWLEEWMKKSEFMPGTLIGMVYFGVLVIVWYFVRKRHRELIESENRYQLLNRELEARIDQRTRELDVSNTELAQQIVMREYAQHELRASNEHLNRYLEELERQNADITRLNLLSDQLHCCESHAELLEVIERSCANLFKTTGGALLEWQGDQLQQLDSSWGAGIDPAWTPPPEALFALQLGRLFPDSSEEQSLLPVVKYHENYVLMAVLQSRGHSIGVLVLLRPTPFWTGETLIDERFDQLLRALVDHTALAFSNLMLREQLREQSLSDPLTGLFNRRYMFQHMAHLIALWERSGQPFSIILIDVDHFKVFNDRFGHDVGDEVLVGIAQVLRREVRKSDIACRMGGEEFVILLGGAEVVLAKERAERLRNAVKALKIKGAPGETLTISAGVAVYPTHGDDAFELLRSADKALYESKRAGRDRISLAIVENG